MPLATDCLHLGKVIGMAEAILINNADKTTREHPVFFCVECGAPVRPHQSRRGHTPHIEHFARNPECSRSNRKGGTKQRTEEPETYKLNDTRALEGYLIDRQIMSYGRNAAIAEQRKKLDDYRCVACDFRMKVNGHFVIECHHLKPVAASGQREVVIAELVSLCPTCHRIAHTRSTPHSVAEVKRLLKNTP